MGVIVILKSTAPGAVFGAFVATTAWQKIILLKLASITNSVIF